MENASETLVKAYLALNPKMAAELKKTLLSEEKVAFIQAEMDSDVPFKIEVINPWDLPTSDEERWNYFGDKDLGQLAIIFVQMKCGEEYRLFSYIINESVTEAP